nr:hypothetical protein [Tanacetum cinerariifolium]
MGDENPIRTLGDYSKPSHEGYRNTIKLPVGNNVVPLRSDTIRLVQMDAHSMDFGSITTWEDLTTQFLAQFFPSGRIVKLRNDILMFQQHHRESLSKAWTRFKDLLQKVPHHGMNRWLKIQIFYDHVSFHLKARLTAPPVPVKAISTPQGISKTLDRRLLELEDQIKFLIKGPRPTLRSSTHIPHAYADAVYSNPRLLSQNEPPKINPFAFCERTGPSPQPQAFGTTFEAQVRDYMATHIKRIERFKNTIFKQHEEINDRMTKMFILLKELTTNRTFEKVLIREEAKFLVTKNVKSISLVKGRKKKVTRRMRHSTTL